MNDKKSIIWLREQCLGTQVFPEPVLQWVTQQKLWNLWVPEAYGGLAYSFTQGLQKLKELAIIDGSLGWTITLCSGANYFIGNLCPQTATAIFKKDKTPILGGSGGAFGIAQREGDSYILSGTWHYATGAPYLTHFTLNAKIVEDGKPIKTAEGTDKILSFVLSKELVEIINDWNTMGLQPTATYSFSVENKKVSAANAFQYNQFYLAAAIYKIPFRVFADLTLWINYIGMATHYLEEAQTHLSALQLNDLKKLIKDGEELIFDYALEIENRIEQGAAVSEKIEKSIHAEGVKCIRNLSKELIRLHPLLGIKASRLTNPLNQIFRDYFTATQHKNFVDR